MEGNEAVAYEGIRPPRIRSPEFDEQSSSFIPTQVFIKTKLDTTTRGFFFLHI